VPDPERGRAVAAELKKLGAKRILIKAAEQGYITELACKMPKCFCPEELGGATYFDPVTAVPNHWAPTLEHFPRPKALVRMLLRLCLPERKRPVADLLMPSVLKPVVPASLRPRLRT
jgi:hypothetical protein